MKRVGARTAIVAAALIAGVTGAGASAQKMGSDAEAFITAIREQDGGKATEIVNRAGAGVLNYRGYTGETPLTVAMARRSATYVGFLLGQGADPNFPDKQGDTGLIIAARTGFSEGFDRMLAAGAKVDVANRKGETALIAAVQSRQSGIVRKLLEAGADPDKADFAAGYSARDYAKRDTRNRDLLKLTVSINFNRSRLRVSRLA